MFVAAMSASFGETGAVGFSCVSCLVKLWPMLCEALDGV